jgi:hypothetical protein
MFQRQNRRAQRSFINSTSPGRSEVVRIATSTPNIFPVPLRRADRRRPSALPTDSFLPIESSSLLPAVHARHAKRSRLDTAAANGASLWIHKCEQRVVDGVGGASDVHIWAATDLHEWTLIENQISNKLPGRVYSGFDPCESVFICGYSLLQKPTAS